MMNKKGQLSVGGIVIIVMGIIVALVILQAVFSGQTQITTKTNVVNETLNKAPAIGVNTNTSYWFALANGCPQTNNNWRLSDTGDCALSGITVQLNNGTALAVNTDYVINTTGGVGKASCSNGATWGDIAFQNTIAVNLSSNTTKVSYTFCQDGYATNSGSRTIASLIGLLSAIAIVIFIFYMGIRNWIE